MIFLQLLHVLKRIKFIDSSVGGEGGGYINITRFTSRAILFQRLNSEKIRITILFCPCAKKKKNDKTNKTRFDAGNDYNNV